MSGITTGWRNAAISLPDVNALLVALAVHSGEKLHQFMAACTDANELDVPPDDDMMKINVPVDIDGATSIYHLTGLGTEGMMCLTLTSFHADPDDDGNPVYDMVVVELGRSGRRPILKPRPRIGTFVDVQGEADHQHMIVPTD